MTEHQVEIPFNFEMSLNQTDTVMTIITGNNLYEVKDIVLRADSLLINMPLFSSRFELKLSGDQMTGFFIRGNTKMPFTAQYGMQERFREKAVNPDKALGRWEIDLNGKQIIGEFQSWYGRIVGSFLTPTGDYRFFEGILTEDNQMLISSFDGGFIRLFRAKVEGDKLLDVEMYSGYSSLETGSGIRNENAELPDAYAITGMKKGYKTLGFTFPDTNGKPVSLQDEQFKNRVTIVQISGSWCPNCLDESRFLMEMKGLYEPDLQIVCLAFERSTEYDKAREQAMKLAEVAEIDYSVLISGYTPSGVKDALPELENFKSFPTTIIIDKKGVVRRIHSGFSGPGTGVHYRNFVAEFKEFIEGLIVE